MNLIHSKLCVLIPCAMILTIFLINLALIKIIYIVFFLVLVVFINLFCLSFKEKKKENNYNNLDIYISSKKAYYDCLERITSKN